MQVNFNNSVNKLNQVQLKNTNTYKYHSKPIAPDTFEHKTQSLQNYDYEIFKKGNSIQLVSFKGLQDPTIVKNPSIRAGLGDSQNYQENIAQTQSIKRGEKLNIEVLPDEQCGYGKIEIQTKDGLILGHLPASVEKALGNTIVQNPDDFSITLYGTTPNTKKNAPNVLMDIEYKGENKPLVQQKLNTLLYKNSITPEQVLHRILDYKKVLYGDEIGTQKIKQTQKNIDTITQALENPKNQKILLIGHNKPDGDTIGSCFGLKGALDYMGKNQVDVAIDDVCAGFLRNVVDSDEIKKSPHFLESLNDGISKKTSTLLAKPKSVDTYGEIFALNKVQKYYNENIKTLNPNEKYDLAVFLDVPSPSKVSPDIKEYAKNAKNIIYIDHHPFQKNEWQKEKAKGGVNIDKVKSNDLFLSEHKVPANTMLVTIIVDKLFPNLTQKFRDSYYADDVSKSDREAIKKISVPLVVGTITDTSGFRRGINKDIEDEKLPPEKKTSFAPAGLSDWLLNLTNGEVTRRSLRKSMRYDLPNKDNFYFPQDFVDFYNTEKANNDSLNTAIPDVDSLFKNTSDEKYVKIAEDVANNTTVAKDIGLGIVKVHHNSMKKFLNEYDLDRPEINMRDIIGAYKYNPTMLALKYSSPDPKLQVDPKYANDKITAMIREEEMEGELNAGYQLSDKNSLGFSFRSQDGTNYAGILATLFGGGGHPSASGATLSLPNLTAESKLSVSINGTETKDYTTIYKALENNYEVNYTNAEKPSCKIELSISDNGDPISDIIENVTREIRQNQ
ncbi:MAG: DHH family phosphoesterase [Candidatus Gastranaerophilales bacterium]|nr:DHH family phosphoesterase [Candidatus Gastranaerophilales bacterium]